MIHECLWIEELAFNKGSWIQHTSKQVVQIRDAEGIGGEPEVRDGNGVQIG